MARWYMAYSDGDPFLVFEGESVDEPPSSVELAGDESQNTSSRDYAREMAAEGLPLSYIASRMGSYNILIPDAGTS